MNPIESKLASFKYRIILGSASPRRRELLKSLGFQFEAKSIRADEDSWPKDLVAEEIPLWLAEMKANTYEEEIADDELLITADTIVWCDNKVFNKPVDFADGRRMLSELSGKMHQVFTAVCLKGAHKHTAFFDEAKVFFKPFTNDEIEYYLTNYSPYDKAGSYGVQDWMGYTGIEKIEGSFYTVMGLPVKMLYEELLKF